MSKDNIIKILPIIISIKLLLKSNSLLIPNTTKFIPIEIITVVITISEIVCLLLLMFSIEFSII
mgnify:CR=1 FL=1